MSETPVEIEVPHPDSFPEAEDFVPAEDYIEEDTKGPGGVVNTPKEHWPEGFDPKADYASPKVEG